MPFTPLDRDVPADHTLTAEPDHCFWGFFDRDRPPVLTVDPGATIDVEVVSHHASDAPDLFMDERLHALWQGIPPEERGPDTVERQLPSRPFEVPVRPHVGVMGVAPAETGRISSVPPGVHGGNVDNWRLGPGAVMRYPVFVDGASLYVGDPHWAQGDGEICGTAIEASLDARLEVWVEDGPITAPILETDTHWFTHGFGDDLDEAMAMAAELLLQFVVDRFGLSSDDAYSLLSVAGDLGITQVVDRRLGGHAAIAKAIMG